MHEVARAEHSSPLFKHLGILKFFDLVTFQISLFMYKFHNHLLPSVFSDFQSVNTTHILTVWFNILRLQTSRNTVNLADK